MSRDRKKALMVAKELDRYIYSIKQLLLEDKLKDADLMEIHISNIELARDFFLYEVDKGE